MNPSTLGWSDTSTSTMMSMTLETAATLTNLRSLMPHQLRPTTLPTPPVAVAEIVSNVQSLSELSVGMRPKGGEGWAWLVHNRSLLVWRFCRTSTRALNCRQLSLPVSGLAHHASLVNVFGETNTRAPAALAVSPEGVVRYWPSVAHPNSCMELTLDLQGEECSALVDVQPLGSILATTTATIGLIQTSDRRDQQGNPLVFRVLKGDQGMLGGIGRRMTSLLWGASGTTSEMKLVSVVTTNSSDCDDDGNTKLVFVLTDVGLQKWIATSETERLVYNGNVVAMAKEAFADTVMLSEVSTASWVKVTPLGAHISTNNQLLLLLAATNQKTKDGSVHFAFAALSIERDSVAMEFDHFWPVKNDNGVLQHAALKEGLDSFRLLVPKDSHVAFICSPSSIISCQYDKEGTGSIETLELGKDDLLGMACDEERSLASSHFFSATHSLFVIEQAKMDTSDISGMHIDDHCLNQTTSNLGKLSETLNLSRVSPDEVQVLSGSEKPENRLKAAFLLFCKQNLTESKRLVSELMASRAPEVDGDEEDDIDSLVVGMSEELIDDFPAGDPRWLETVPDSSMVARTLSSGTSTSTLIQHQLEDKQKALEVFVTFLKRVELWNKLRQVRFHGSVICTAMALRSHVEKTAAAIALRSLHNEHQELVDGAIRQCLSQRESNNNKDDDDTTLNANTRFLTPQDYFYRKISAVDDIIEGLRLCQDEVLKTEKDGRQIVSVVLQVNAILVRMVREAQSVFTVTSADALNKYSSYVTWTTSLSLRTRLIDQFKVTLSRVSSVIDDAVTKKNIESQLIELADVVLNGLKERQWSSDEERNDQKEAKKDYESIRYELVMALVDNNLMEAAAAVAEKYLEFNGLVAVCERLNDDNRLKHYLSLYADQGMAEVLFEWHMRHGKKGTLISNFGQDEKLGHFLNNHSSISWIHDIGEDKLEQAASTLLQLAQNEQRRIAKRKVLLSLSKLSWLASDSNDIENEVSLIDNDLNLISMQEQLPMELLRLQMENNDLNDANIRVLKPREMIELFICDNNKDADLVDFQRALALLDFINDEDGERERLKSHIWAKAVLRDDWIALDVDKVSDVIKDTLFIRLAKDCSVLIENYDERFLPSMEELLECEDLQHVSGSSKFQFLLKSAYETLARNPPMEIN